jgi:hypothetical protein
MDSACGAFQWVSVRKTGVTFYEARGTFRSDQKRTRTQADQTLDFGVLFTFMGSSKTIEPIETIVFMEL